MWPFWDACCGLSGCSENAARAGETPENDEFAAVLACFGESVGHGRVVLVALGVDEEGVLPVVASARAFVDVREVDAGLIEDAEHRDEGAVFVDGVEHNACFVVAGSLGALLAEDVEACDVVGVVFDFLEEGVEAVELARERGPDGGRAGRGADACRDAVFFDGDLGGLAGTGRGDEFGVRVLGSEPCAALAERFGLGVNATDLAGFAVGEQGVVNGDLDFGVDEDVSGVFGESGEGFGDASACGVFDGDEAVVDVSAADFGDDASDFVEVFEGDAGAELFDSGEVGV